MQKHPQFSIERGVSVLETYLTVKLRHCFEKYGNTMDFITGDGGFDFADYNGQENHRCVTFNCICIIITKSGGNFVVKVFDMFTDYLLILFIKQCYGEVIVQKPLTSRSPIQNDIV